MLTPVFKVDQDDEFIFVIIRAPFANLSESEFYVDDCDFKFYAKPYYLRLNFPGPLVEDGRESASYDADEASFTIKVPKAETGQHFPDLDLLTKLLAPAGSKSAKEPIIEVLDESNEPPEDDEDDSFDWQIEQEPVEPVKLSLDGPKYGFASRRFGVLSRLQSEFSEIFDLKDADTIQPSERRALRILDEDSHFSKDHYWADLFEADELESSFQYQPPWSTGKSSDSENFEFSDYENDVLQKIPRKEYILDANETRRALLGLIDILFAYVYDKRTTAGENTVESGWTIAKLSSTLTWFEVFSEPKEVLLSCYRRSLCYPLYRNWRLSECVAKDVCAILAHGRRMVLRCLIDIRRIFIETGDQRYILNDLYVDDYCSWVQQISNKKITSLADHLSQITMAKQDVGFDLEELELTGRLAVEGQNDAADVGKVRNDSNLDSDDERLSTSSDSNSSSDDDDDDSVTSVSSSTSSDSEDSDDSVVTRSSISSVSSIETKDKLDEDRAEILVDEKSVGHEGDSDDRLFAITDNSQLDKAADGAGDSSVTNCTCPPSTSLPEQFNVLSLDEPPANTSV